MKWTVLIPVADNDGVPFGQEVLTEICERLALQFGGCTIERGISGMWLHQGVVMQDEHVRVSVLCDDDRRAEAREAVLQIGRETRQICMYWEVASSSEVEIIPVD